MTVFSGHFVDGASVLGKLERTPQGGYVAPGTFATVGVMKYSARQLRSQGVPVPAEVADSAMIGIYLPPEAIESSYATLRGAPVTREHPERFVSPQTYTKVSRGVVTDVAFDGKALTGRVALQDADLIADVEAGARRGLSPGYNAVTDFSLLLEGKDAVTPDGQRYQAVRKSMTYNHAAVVTNPRGGEVASLALDSDEIPTEEEPIVKLKIKGVETDATVAQPVIDSLESEASVLRAERDAARADLAKTKEELVKATSPETIQKYVKDAKDKEAVAAERAARVAKIKQAYPTMAFDESSDAVLEALEKVVAANDAADPDGTKKLAGKLDPEATPAEDSAAPVETARDRYLKQSRGAWRQVPVEE